jgi:hypothetical protein
MTSPKPRYEPGIGSIVEDIEFDASQLDMLRSIKNDDAFVSDIRNIAMIYGCLCRSEPEELSAGEFRATLKDLNRDATTLVRKLKNLPESVELALWRLSYRKDAPPVMDNLRALLKRLINEIEVALETNSSAKPGRKIATANWYAANSVKRCFESYGMVVTVNQWPDSPESPAALCLGLIFASSGRSLSRSAVEEYLKPN